VNIESVIARILFSYSTAYREVFGMLKGEVTHTDPLVIRSDKASLSQTLSREYQ